MVMITPDHSITDHASTLRHLSLIFVQLNATLAITHPCAASQQPITDNGSQITDHVEYALPVIL